MYCLETEILKPKSKKKPKNAIILCHGYAGKGKNIALLANFWRLHLNDTIFFCPNAPEKCNEDNLNYQWFSPSETNKHKLKENVKKSEKKLNQFIDQILNENSLTEKELVIGGFSQGCMLALEAGLRRKKKIRAILGYSGKIVDTQNIINHINSKPDIYLFHGEKDEIVLPKYFFETEKFLKKNKFKVFTKLFKNCDHRIPAEAANLGLDFVKNAVL